MKWTLSNFFGLHYVVHIRPLIALLRTLKAVLANKRSLDSLRLNLLGKVGLSHVPRALCLTCLHGLQFYSCVNCMFLLFECIRMLMNLTGLSLASFLLCKYIRRLE